MNSTPSSNRKHIGIFGSRNAGKSTLMNAIIGQDLSVVSPVKGTTTDTVSKAMEILPAGPVVLMDAPGYDDEGELGELRVGKCLKTLDRADLALLVIDGTLPPSDVDIGFISRMREKRIPFIIVTSKRDAEPSYRYGSMLPGDVRCISVSARTGEGIKDLKDLIAASLPASEEIPIIRDILREDGIAMLVIPIDKAAPKGRLILPQQQTIRDILDGRGRVMVVSPEQVASTISQVRPDIVVTDSQAFEAVAASVPDDIPLTSFSILFARHKGNLEDAVRGAASIRKLKDGDRVLISEGCTHHRQCGDIGSEKIPRMLRKVTGKDLNFEFSSGQGFPEDLSRFSLVIHCGGCMLTERDMQLRYAKAVGKGVPITNYGIFLAYGNGILRRSLSVFPEYQRMLD